MKNLFQQRNEISIVNDKWGSPTPVEFVSEHIKFLVNNNSLNIYNVTIYNLSSKDQMADLFNTQKIYFK